MDFFLFPFLGFLSQRDGQSPFSPVSPCGCLFINGVEQYSESHSLSLWSFDCNGNSRQGWSVTVLSNDQGQHAGESEQPGSLAITTGLMLPPLSALPVTNWFVNVLGGTLSEKDTLYLLWQIFGGTKYPFHAQTSLLDSFLHSIPS